MPPFHKVLARNMKAERGRNSWFQDEFGRRIGGWTASKVSSVEKGKTRISVEELVPICRALGKTLAELAVDCDPDELTILGL